MRLLIIKTSSLGDVIHNLPAVSDIVSRAPGVEIDWLVEEGFAEIPRLHPAVRRVIPVALRRWRRGLLSPATWREFARFRRELKAESYDKIIDTQGLVKSAWLARLARGPSCGQDRTTARESLAAGFYDQCFHVPCGRHAVERNRDLAAQALGYPLPQTPPDYGIRAPKASFSFTVPKKFIVGLHATSRDSKRWPAAHWVALGQELEGHGIALLLPWGSAAEEQHAREIAQSLKRATVLPRLSLRELAALMGRAHAVVGVDTGLVHLAVALGRPTVAIYTDSSPALTGVLATRSGSACNLGDVGRVPEPVAVKQALTGLGLL
ncbi:lipopolysaccharide heptosyltransferase [Sulfuricaulis limicola]|uniref:Lipopolysaccharide heptosyltransferase 1 n=1 Tax=Sulfuricaulis limicola TaxID=1620215 RepID=A0A1B4XJI7_9GAMM|nr:lipopolysaccharide heptosyltransferase I [Sulfuricaulis limicola]BAV34960.1 lipopolysaccharide heptosyltransferase [Sulfuricaulis limicola]